MPTSLVCSQVPGARLRKRRRPGVAPRLLHQRPGQPGRGQQRVRRRQRARGDGVGRGRAKVDFVGSLPCASGASGRSSCAAAVASPRPSRPPVSTTPRDSAETQSTLRTARCVARGGDVFVRIAGGERPLAPRRTSRPACTDHHLRVAGSSVSGARTDPFVAAPFAAQRASRLKFWPEALEPQSTPRTACVHPARCRASMMFQVL